MGSTIVLKNLLCDLLISIRVFTKIMVIREFTYFMLKYWNSFQLGVNYVVTTDNYRMICSYMYCYMYRQ